MLYWTHEQDMYRAIKPKGTTYYSSDMCTLCLTVFCIGAVVMQASIVSDYGL